VTSRPYEIPELAAPAFWHFGDVLDVIWKAPDFIDAQREMELESLRCAGDSSNGHTRWHFEHRKLWGVFPGLLANANTFLVTSLLELHLRMILEQVSEGTPPKPQRGIRETLSLLKHQGFRVEATNRWSQIDALIRIRNCLMHAAGVLHRSKDSDALEQLVTRRAYLAPTHAAEELGEETVRIIEQRFGRRLVVNNMYAWLAAAYCREFIVELCGGDALEA
jgi:hypothetical protein